MLAISPEQAHGVLSIESAAGIVDATYRAIADGNARASSPSILRMTDQPFRLGAKGAVLEHLGIAGIRLTSRSAPRLILWSLETGEPIAILDESHAYRFRTGVSAAVSARYLLGHRPVKKAAIIGAGPIAFEAARAVSQLIAPSEIAVAARSAASSQGFAAQADTAGFTVTPAPDAASALDGATLVITITSANEVLVRPENVGQGAVVLSMGGGLEVSDQVWRAAGLRLVDDLDYALGQGDAAAWIASARYDQDTFCQSLNGTVADLAAGRIAPPAANVTAMAIVQGTTALDVALAFSVFQALGGKP